jgi:hypothetical protein
MQKLRLLALSFFVIYNVDAQQNFGMWPLADTIGLTAVNVQLSVGSLNHQKSVRVADGPGFTSSELKFAKLSEVEFHNGIIELELAGQPLATASETARGFVGIAFRISSSNDAFECLYLRPTNGRANDQVRRNHATQYISHPDFPWHRLRKEFPEMYESYTDLEPGKWTKVKIVVKDSTAQLYVHNTAQPCLIVNDLKHGAAMRGAIGLWIGPGTEAYFRNLKISPLKD